MTTLTPSVYSVENAVSTYLATNWTYTSIREINKDDAPAIPYIEMYCKPGRVFELEIGGCGERSGIIKINIYTAKGVGVQQGFSYGGKLEELFWNQDISGVICQNESIQPYTEFIGIDEALQACHHQTTIPFWVLTENS
jgi:hypothetical protein